jgi:hypothetical protein
LRRLKEAINRTRREPHDLNLSISHRSLERPFRERRGLHRAGQVEEVRRRIMVGTLAEEGFWP